MINIMEMGILSMRMGINIEVVLVMIRSMEQEFIDSLMGTVMKENGLPIIRKGMEYSRGKMETLMKDIGEKGIEMELELPFTVMEINMLENGNLERSMEREF